MAQRPTLFSRLISPAVSRGRAFARDDRGVTAVEFGILALPFFTIIFAILETTMVFLAGQVLDGAVEDASRQIKTGQAQSFEIDDFRALMCEYTFRLFGPDCSGVRVVVDVIDDFTSTETATMPTTTCEEDEDGKVVCELDVEEDYAPGAGGSVVQVTAYYRWPLVIALPYFNLANQPDNARLLAATRVFRNEPFGGS
jgi:Flp pilus assembly pilin Flp